MMKRFMRIFLMAAVFCLLTATALAVDATILPARKDTEPLRTIQEMIGVGDTVYFTVRTDEGGQIWHWREDMPQAEPIADGIVFSNSYTQMDAAALLDGKAQAEAQHAIAFVLTDGKDLYGYNSLNRLVFKIGFEGGKAVYTDVVTLQEHEEMTSKDGIFRAPHSVCIAGDYLLWGNTTYRQELSRSVYPVKVFSLKDGSCRTLVEDEWNDMILYKDGMVLLATRAWTGTGNIYDAYHLRAYDPAKDRYYDKGTVTNTDFNPIGVYDPVKDIHYRQEGQNIMGKEHLMGMPEVYAAIPEMGNYNLAVVGDTIVLMRNNEVLARTLVKGYEPETILNVCGSSRVGEEQFRDEYPTVYINSAGSEEADVFATLAKSNADEKFRENKGYMDLSGSEIIREYVEDLYPQFKELAVQDGKIITVPVSVDNMQGFYINKRVMQDVGLESADVPSNFVDLCAFITEWNSTNALTKPNWTVVEYAAPSYRSRILNMMLEGWSRYLEANDLPVHYDDPVLRQMLTALDAMDASNLDANNDRDNPEDSDYMQGLIWDKCKLVGNFSSYMEVYSDRVFLPMTLTPETAYSVCVDFVEIWGAAADTEHPEEAIAYIESKLSDLTARERAVMLQSAEPEKNPEYETIVEKSQKVLDDLNAIEWVYSDAAYWSIRKAIDEQEAFIAQEMLRMQYRVAPSALENYRNVIVPAMFIGRDDASFMYRYTGQWPLNEMYAMKLIDMETYLKISDEFVQLNADREAGVERTDEIAQLADALANCQSNRDFEELLAEFKLTTLTQEEIRQIIRDYDDIEVQSGNG